MACVEALTLNIMLSGGETFGRQFGSNEVMRVKPYDVISALIRTEQRPYSALSALALPPPYLWVSLRMGQESFCLQTKKRAPILDLSVPGS